MNEVESLHLLLKRKGFIVSYNLIVTHKNSLVPFRVQNFQRLHLQKRYHHFRVFDLLVDGCVAEKELQRVVQNAQLGLFGHVLVQLTEAFQSSTDSVLNCGQGQKLGGAKQRFFGVEKVQVDLRVRELGGVCEFELPVNVGDLKTLILVSLLQLVKEKCYSIGSTVTTATLSFFSV